jgi:hypothetical protein
MMNITQQIEIMKFETRLANRAWTEGIANWTPEARAKSLAVRRAKGSVWGWDKRPRYKPFGAEKDSIDLMSDALSEADAKRRKQIALEDAGKTFIGPRDKYADQIAAQRLESFKKWLAEVKRVEGAIDQFNGTVAALGGLTSGAALARKGKSIGPVTVDPAAEAAAKKAAVEKSIRRNYEKRNEDHLRKYPEERDVMLDMVAEKAEYYSAQPARKVEMEKAAYRRIREAGSTQMRETPALETKDYKTLLSEKRAFVQEREAVRVQLKPGESAHQVLNGFWIGRMPDGQERLIRSTTPSRVQSVNDDLLDAMEEARLGARMGSGVIVNRHTSACATSKGEKCNCSCGGSQHGTEAGATPGKTEEPAEPKDTSEMAKPKGEEDPEASADFEGLVSSFKALIEKGEKPTRRTLIEQFKKDLNGPKLQLAIPALAEAWHTYSLDKFQEKYERDPKNNFEFRTFQKKSGVPPEFIGGK